MARSWGRQWLIVTLALVLGAGAALIPSGSAAHAPDRVGVIVQSVNGQPAAAGAVREVGGTVTRDLSLVDGVAASVTPSQAAQLAASPGVNVTPDATMSVGPAATAASTSGSTETSTGGGAPAATAKPGGGGSGGGGSKPPPTPVSLFDQVIGADKVWKAGDKGAGQTVALIDTGIADVPDLASRVLTVQTDALGTTARCENLSGEAGCNDNYGHGTFIAGLIAGTGASSGGARTGVAPAANLVSVKVAGRSGSADVSTVLAAIQWVVSFKDQYKISVLNLSLGTDSTQSWTTDPLNYAVEKAWSAGIVVVVSASNRGPAAGTISKPADDPWVVTVGAVDNLGTVSITDDVLPDFSGRGPTHDGLSKPDLAAPGAHLVSVSSPGSAVDQQFPSTIDSHYRTGSGTSMSAGVVSGTVALMRAANPKWTPDRVKYALARTSRPVASNNALAVGSGEIDAYAATFKAPSGTANAGLGHSTGLGNLDLSRGSVRVALDDPLNTVVTGTQTAQLLTWNQTAFLAPWTSVGWYTTDASNTVLWYGSNWQGSNWQGSNWQGATYYGSNWQANYWQGFNVQGSNWQGSTWYGAWDRTP